MDMIEHASTCDITTATRDATAAATAAAGRFADAVIGAGPLPGTDEWNAEQSTELPARRTMSWHLLSLRIQLAVGLDGVETVLVLRTLGATWATIGKATAMTRQSAHERWNARVTAVLDPEGTGLPAIVPDDAPE